jgi:3'-phosphoadenosine 5'-phosphosulfate sulfotransferase (PAPS reductase)/FAD synthetase
MSAGQADILPGMPDRLAKIPPKAREYAALTLDEAIAKAHALVDEVLNRYSPEHVLLAYSGGEDSAIVTHLLRERATALVHINTGISVPATAVHVRDIAAQWRLELIEAAPPRTYEDLILGKVLSTRGGNIGRQVWKGFPGPAAHNVMYNRLKERALDRVRRMLVGPRGRTGQIVQLAGMRWAESDQRFRNASEIDPRGARVWCSPIVWWTEGHMREYRARYRCQLAHDHGPHMLCTPGALPRNEVTQHLHMSGDCLCGAYAQDGEIYGIELFYPEIAERLHELERRALAQGDIPPQRCVWGWGAGRERPSGAGPMCSRCQAPAEIPGQEPLFGAT